MRACGLYTRSESLSKRICATGAVQNETSHTPTDRRVRHQRSRAFTVADVEVGGASITHET
jgi:hypothetical protein